MTLQNRKHNSHTLHCAAGTDYHHSRNAGAAQDVSPQGRSFTVSSLGWFTLLIAISSLLNVVGFAQSGGGGTKKCVVGQITHLDRCCIIDEEEGIYCGYTLNFQDDDSCEAGNAPCALNENANSPVFFLTPCIAVPAVPPISANCSPFLFSCVSDLTNMQASVTRRKTC